MTLNLTRRAVLTAAGAGLLLVPAAPLVPAHATAIPPGNQVPFLVRRDGDRIGQHTLTFRREGDDTVVDVAIGLGVFIGPIRVFRYNHSNREVWRNGRLISLVSETDNDGDDYAVRGETTGDGFRVSGADGTQVLPDDIISTSYWRRETVEQDRLLNTQNGRVMAVQVAPLGTETIRAAGQDITASRYRTSGDLQLDVWYSEAGQWVKLRFENRGSEIDYELVDTGGGRALATL